MPLKRCPVCYQLINSAKSRGFPSNLKHLADGTIIPIYKTEEPSAEEKPSTKTAVKELDGTLLEPQVNLFLQRRRARCAS